MFACEKAVKLDPNNVNIRFVRGLARALTGNYKGAITDFEAYIAQTDDKIRLAQLQEKIEALREKYQDGKNIARIEDKVSKAQLQEYVKALRVGKNPFTQSELNKLRGE